jgi:hypothetical protein
MTCSKLTDGWCTEPMSVAHKLRPSPGVCSVCEHYDGPARGLGDIVHTVAQVTGVAAVVKAVAPDCGCEQRRQALNQSFPKAP